MGREARAAARQSGGLRRRSITLKTRGQHGHLGASRCTQPRVLLILAATHSRDFQEPLMPGIAQDQVSLRGILQEAPNGQNAICVVQALAGRIDNGHGILSAAKVQRTGVWRGGNHCAPPCRQTQPFTHGQLHVQAGKCRSVDKRHGR